MVTQQSTPRRSGSGLITFCLCILSALGGGLIGLAVAHHEPPPTNSLQELGVDPSIAFITALQRIPRADDDTEFFSASLGPIESTETTGQNSVPFTSTLFEIEPEQFGEFHGIQGDFGGKQLTVAQSVDSQGRHYLLVAAPNGASQRFVIGLLDDE